MATTRYEIVVSVTGASQASRSIDGVGAAGERAARSLGTLRTVLGQLRALLVVTAGAAVIGRLTSSLIDFNDAIKETAALVGASQDDFNRLSAKARELGASTRFTATEAAQGLSQLARAGFDADQSLKAIDSTLLLARVGNLDLASAADISTNVLDGFGLKVSELPKVLDELAFAATRSNTDVKQLGEAFKFVAPLAGAAKISTGEVAAALATLAQSGLRSGIAGRGFAQLLTSLEAPSAEIQKVLAKLGVSLNSIRPSAVGFGTALDNLRKTGLSAGAILSLFSSNAGRVLVALLRGKEGLDEFNKGIKDSGGSLQGLSDKMHSLRDDALAVSSAAQEVVLSLGDVGGNEALSKFLQGLANTLRDLAKHMDDVVRAFTAFFVVVAVAKITRLALALLNVRAIVISLSAAFAANPIGLLVTGAAIAAATLGALADKLNLVDDGTIKLSDAMSGFADVAGGVLVDAINALGGSFSDFGDDTDTTLTRAARGFTRLLAVIGGILKAIEAGFKNLGPVLLSILQDMLNALVREVLHEVNTISTIFNKGLEFFGLKQVPLLDSKDFLISIPGAKEGGEILGNAFTEGFNDVIKKTLEASQIRRFGAVGRGAPVPPPAPGRTGRPQPVPTELGATDIKDVLNPALESLVSSVSPAAKAMKELSDATETFATSGLSAAAVAKKFGISQDEVLNRVQRAAAGFDNAQTDIKEQLKLADEAFKNHIVTLDEYRKRLLDLKGQQADLSNTISGGLQSGFIDLLKEVNNVGDQAKKAFTGAVNAASDALVEFVQTGKVSFADLARSLAADLLKLGFKQAVAGFGQAAGFGPQGATSNGGFNPISAIGSLVGGLFGGGSSFSLPFANAQAAVDVANLPFFAVGGSFNVGATTSQARIPGVDNRLVAFRAQDGENVTVTPRGRKPGGGSSVTQVFNVNVPDTDSARMTAVQIQNRSAAALSDARRRR